MDALRRREGGFVLTEVLLVMVIGTLLLGATLLTFERFVTHSNTSDTHNDSIEEARRALDVQARQLRNLAKRRPLSPPVLDTVLPDDLIFQTSDSERTWVRYCVDQTNPAAAVVYQQTQSIAVTAAAAPVSAGMRGPCPSAGDWDRTIVVADNVVNRINGRNVPMFTYRCAIGSACTASAATYEAVIGIDSQLYIDTTPTGGPVEERVVSGVYLRNQNQAPVARFTVTRTAPRTVLLNASGSTDYEQRTLTYYWFDVLPTAIRCDVPPALDQTTNVWGGGRLLGRGVSLQYAWPGTTPATGSAQTIGLVACDPGDKSSLLTQSVVIPS